MHYNRPLQFLRCIAYEIFVLAITLLFGLPVLICSLFSYSLAAELAKTWARLNLFGLAVLCNLDVDIQGQEHIPEHGCIVLSKHQSTWEAFFLFGTLRNSAFVAKKSLLWIPFFGWAVARLRFIMIDRQSGRAALKQMFEQARDRLSDGISIVVFPEGTRMPPGAKTNYRIGGAAIAAQTGADVLPVALNSGEYWPRNGFIKKPGTISVRFGPLISSAGKTAAQINLETETWIEAEMAKLAGDNNPMAQHQYPTKPAGNSA